MATAIAIAQRKATAAERLIAAASKAGIAPPELSRKAPPEQQIAELLEWAAAALEAAALEPTPAAAKRRTSRGDA